MNRLLLLIDRDARLAALLASQLGEGWDVRGVRNREELAALPALPRPDAVLGEAILEAGLDGLDILGRYQSLGVPALVWTRHNIDDLVRDARDRGLTVIAAKTHPILLGELVQGIRTATEGFHSDILRHLGAGGGEIARARVASESEVGPLCQRIQDSLQGELRVSRKLRLVLDELVTNALHHAVVPGIEVVWGKDAFRHVFQVVDASGGLDGSEALRVIDRHFRSEGVLDPRGRGLHLSRIYADRLYLTVIPGRCTEAVAVFWNRPGSVQGFKPVWFQRAPAGRED